MSRLHLPKASISVVSPPALFCAPSGSDAAGDGSYANPYFSVGKAATIMHDTGGGYTCYARGGTYAYTLDAQPNVHVGVSGSALAPFVFRNYPDEHPVITLAAGTTSWGFLISGSNFVQVRGFEVCPADRAAIGFEITESSDCLVEQCEYWSTVPTSGQIGVHIHAKVAASGAATDRNTVRNNYFHDFGGAVGEGVYLKKWLDNADSVDGNVIERNLFSGVLGSEAFQVSSHISAQVPTNTTFRNNVVRCACADVGATMLQASGLILDSNVFVGSGGTYGCLVITLNAYTTLPNIIRNNLIVWSANSAQNIKGINVVAGDASGVVNMYHNTIANIVNAGAGEAYGFGLYNKAGTYEIKNNIVYHCDEKVIDAGTAIVTTDYNNLHGTAGDNGTNAQTGDPVFADTEYYRLTATSPGLASGVGGLCVLDLDGRIRNIAAPSMGCREF